VYAALFGAVIAAATALVRIPLPTGYYHAGDAFIYLAAVCIPTPYAAAGAAVGASLADLLSGYPVYAPFTFVIKALLTLAFTRSAPHIICRRNMLALAVAAAITVFGYFAADAVITGSAATALSDMIPNLIQAAVGAAIFLPVAAVMDRLGLRKKLFLFDR